MTSSLRLIAQTSAWPRQLLGRAYDALVSINVPNDKARAVVDAMERDMDTTLATKTDVRRAVQELFDVTVVRVHTQTRKGKPRRTRFRSGRTGDWKKAIVTLDTEDRIEFF